MVFQNLVRLLYRAKKLKKLTFYCPAAHYNILYSIGGFLSQSGWAIGFSSPLKTFELYLAQYFAEEQKTNLKTCLMVLQNLLRLIYGAIFLLN